MDIVEYIVISESATESLEEEVDKAIKKGWKPQGGVVVDGSAFYQAMVK
jgi:hypothetical protein